MRPGWWTTLAPVRGEKKGNHKEKKKKAPGGRVTEGVGPELEWAVSWCDAEHGNGGNEQPFTTTHGYRKIEGRGIR